MAGQPERIVIVGGGQAGGRLAQALVAAARPFSITLICREPHPPYQRPPLSKGVLLGTASLDDCLIWPPDDRAWKAVDLRLGVSATSIDREARRVHLEDGKSVAYDRLVLATGSRVRRLSVPGSDRGNIHCLRSVDQAQEIAKHFARGKRLMIVGGGFIGLEIAASARLRHLDITVVEASDRLLARVVPNRIASMLASRHRAEGVRLHMGAMVEEFETDVRGVAKAARLSSGEMLPCDLAVVGVGVAANVELAEAAGLATEVGVRVDASLRTSDPAIFACGDVATFWHPVFDRFVRVEAFQNAEDHARVIAGVLEGGEAVCDTVPFFWSDQYDLSLQIVGLPHLGSSTVTRQDNDGAVILFHLRADGRIVGATGLGTVGAIGRDIRLAQALIAARSYPDPAVLSDPGARLKTLLDRGTPDAPAFAVTHRSPRPAAPGL
ncbi:MAG: FAD-dependent oxidoreductase [Bauldia sp.]|nr:FAD-dependent oxidoreductase [Bauldia sp.]